jgi:ferric-dicitrate binding protein FerR (iron transport regulator)
VYGTSFNVNALESAKFVKVTLIEGSVSLSSKGEKIEGKNEFFITPGQTVTYQQNTKDVTLQTDDTFLYTAWKNGIIIFRNKTFASVLQQLSEKFNVDIELKDNSLAAIPMDATFRDENINEILRLLALSTPFRYHYGEQQKLADGTFAKSKIYIERK